MSMVEGRVKFYYFNYDRARSMTTAMTCLIMFHVLVSGLSVVRHNHRTNLGKIVVMTATVYFYTFSGLIPYLSEKKHIQETIS